MKKLSLYVVLCAIFLVSNVEAKLNSISNMASAKNSVKQMPPIVGKTAFQKELDKLETDEEKNEYIANRAKNFTISDRSAISNIGGGAFSAIDPISARLMKERDKGNEKSLFDDIFDKAVSRAENKKNSENSNFIPAITEEMIDAVNQKAQAQKRNINVPQISTVKINLPGSDKVVDIPTDEHIPYFYSNINVREDGKVEISETILAVATGKKIKDKFTRVFPEFSLDRNQDKHPYDIKVLSTKINDQPIDYKLTKDDGYQYLELSNGSEITPGVYKFTISYLVDRHISFYDDFDEFAWNVTGNNWNLVINRASASLKLPNKTEALGVQAASIRYNGILEDVLIKRSSNDDYLFALKNPLAIAQGFKIITSIEKGLITKPSFLDNFNNSISDNITFIISLVTLLVIVISMAKTQFIISKNNKEKGNFANPKINKLISTSDARYILNKKVDAKSLVSVIMSLIYNKNKITIEKDNDKIILIKKTDSKKGLNPVERLVFNGLFSKENTEFIIAPNNSLKLKRILSDLNKLTIRRFSVRTLEKIFGYFSIALLMIIISIFANVFINDGLILNASIASMSSGLLLGASFILYNKYDSLKSKKIANIIINVVALFFAISAIIGLLYCLNAAITLNITLSVVTIAYYTKLFSSEDYIGYHIVRDVKNHNLYIEKVLNGKIKNVDEKKLYGYMYSFNLDNKINDDDKLVEKKISEII